VIKSRGITQARYEASMGDRKVPYRVLVGKSGIKRPKT